MATPLGSEIRDIKDVTQAKSSIVLKSLTAESLEKNKK
jgi:hypothetical protein